MQNILDICKEFGLEIPADKQSDFNKKVAENVTEWADTAVKMAWAVSLMQEVVAVVDVDIAVRVVIHRMMADILCMTDTWTLNSPIVAISQWMASRS